MGVRVLVGTEQGVHSTDRATLFCSTSDWAFGPVFYDFEDKDKGRYVCAGDVAEAFDTYVRQKVNKDPRRLEDSALEHLHADFITDLASGVVRGPNEVVYDV